MNREYLIQEKPMKAILILAIPMIIGNLFQQFYLMNKEAEKQELLRRYERMEKRCI